MGSNQKSLNRRIRETISALSDEDLANMLGASPVNYTPFARRVAEEEASRRKQMKEAQEGSDQRRVDCYVEIWSDKDFQGEYLRIEGPSELKTLQFVGSEWGDRICSLRVGPTAFVLVYADKEFKGEMMTFGPGQDVADLEAFSFDDEIDSIRLVNSMKVFDVVRKEDVKLPERGRSAKNKAGKKTGGRKLAG